jgi:hypothetical protein
MNNILDEEDIRIRLSIIRCIIEKLNEHKLSDDAKIALLYTMFRETCIQSGVDPDSFIDFMRKYPV